MEALHPDFTASGKRPRSKDDSSQVGKKTKGTCVCPVCDEGIKEPTKNKMGDEAIYMRVPVKPGFTVDVLVYCHLILLSSKMMTGFCSALIASLRWLRTVTYGFL